MWPGSCRRPDKGDVEIVDLGAADEIDQAVEAARQAIEQSAAKIKKPEDEEQPAEASGAGVPDEAGRAGP